MTTPSEQPNAPAAAPTPARRTQRRISVQIPIKVYRPGSKMPITAMNHDISWGGAQFVATVPVAWMTGRLRLDFPWAGGQQISIDAEVVRAQQLSEGVSQVAVRFVSLSPRCQVRLEKLLTMLDPGGQGSADGVTEPLFQGIELEIHDLPEMREALQQIAEGRLKLVVTEPYQARQSLCLAISGIPGLATVKLRARVLKVAPSTASAPGQQSGYLLILGFEHPPDSIKEFANLLMAQLGGVAHTTSSESAAPDTGRRARVIGPLSPDPATRSSLEVNHQDALRSLSLCWGDPEAFDDVFKELTFGSLSIPGGWPPEAWDELGFLQDIHDLAYGLSSFRASAFRPGRDR